MYFQVFKRKHRPTFTLHCTYPSPRQAQNAFRQLRIQGFKTHVKVCHLNPVGPYTIQDDLSGKVLWMGDASDARHAIELMRRDEGYDIPDGYLVVTAITKELQDAILALGDDVPGVARLLDNYVAAS